MTTSTNPSFIANARVATAHRVPRRSAFAVAALLATALLATALLAAVSAAQGAVVTYTSEAAWHSSVNAPRLIDFDDLAAGTPVSNQYAGVTFSSFKNGVPMVVAESNPFSGLNTLKAEDPKFNGAGGGVSIGFAPASGFGIWYNDAQFANNIVTVYSAANSVLATFELIFPHPTQWQFVGFISANNDIARVDIAIPDEDRVTFDNVQLAAATVVPAPSTLSLYGLAAFAMFGLSWRARRADDGVSRSSRATRRYAI